MVDFATHSTASDGALDTIVQRIAPLVQPELILLFGSRAAGTARDDSDYDVMLVLREAEAIEPARAAANKALGDAGLSVDVLACTVEEYQRRQHDPGYLSWLIAREGRVLYTTGRVPQRSPSPDRVREAGGGEGLAMWIRRAESDLRAAENSLAAAHPSWDAICFHAHACVEKLLKALIVTRGTFPPRTHQLKDLLALQEEGIRESAVIIRACGLLTALYPKARYPEAPEPSPAEAHSAMATAREARLLLMSRLDRWAAIAERPDR